MNRLHRHMHVALMLRVLLLVLLSSTCAPGPRSSHSSGSLVGFHVAAQMPLDVNPYLPLGVPPSLFPIFDPDIDNTDARGGVIASAIFSYLTRFSPSLTFGDASMTIWARAVRLVAQFDATAPFHPTAVGIYTRLPRQQAPAPEDEMLVFNTAVLHASYHVLMNLQPVNEPEWRLMMNLTGLDADDESLCTPEDTVCSPVAIGNTAGLGVVESRMFTDGFNWGGLMARSGPYFPSTAEDYTGYKAVNSAFHLRDAARWQPTVTEQQTGVYKVQQFVTPQWALTETYAPGSADAAEFAAPTASDPRNTALYKEQADAVLRASADLTDEKKMKAEFFDNKGILFLIPFTFLDAAAEFTPFERLHLELAEATSAHDAGVAVWRAKRKFDAVRPFSAIRKLYANQSVTAYGGPGVGTVDDLPGEDWQSYLKTADHPEYPSATACFCASVVEAWKLSLGTDILNASFPSPPGTSNREPGVTPTSLITVTFPTLDDFVEDCAISRVDAGTHFPFAVEQSMQECPKIGAAVYEWLDHHISGAADVDPPRPPSMGLPLSSLPDIMGPYAPPTNT